MAVRRNGQWQPCHMTSNLWLALDAVRDGLDPYSAAPSLRASSGWHEVILALEKRGLIEQVVSVGKTRYKITDYGKSIYQWKPAAPKEQPRCPVCNNIVTKKGNCITPNSYTHRRARGEETVSRATGKRRRALLKKLEQCAPKGSDPAKFARKVLGDEP